MISSHTMPLDRNSGKQNVDLVKAAINAMPHKARGKIDEPDLDKAIKAFETFMKKKGIKAVPVKNGDTVIYVYDEVNAHGMDSAGESRLDYIARIACFTTPVQLNKDDLKKKPLVRQVIKSVFDVGTDIDIRMGSRHHGRSIRVDGLPLAVDTVDNWGLKSCFSVPTVVPKAQKPRAKSATPRKKSPKKMSGLEYLFAMGVADID